jgi:hypothetical protein
MPGVEQIEHAIGENDACPAPATPGRGGLGRADLVGGVQSGCVALGWNEKL